MTAVFVREVLRASQSVSESLEGLGTREAYRSRLHGAARRLPWPAHPMPFRFPGNAHGSRPSATHSAEQASKAPLDAEGVARRSEAVPAGSGSDVTP